MRIVCPACAASYEVPAERLAPGRVVRCARCETDWMPSAPVPAEAPEAELAFAPELATMAEPEIVAPLVAVAEPPVLVATPLPPVARAPSSWALRAAWGATAIVLAAALWFAYAARDGIMQAWPPSVRAYAAMGLAARR